MKYLKVPIAEQQKLLEFLKKGKKIQAIKQLRNFTGCGLRESKDAIDTLQGRGPKSPSAVIRAPWVINSIAVTTPTGKCVELSLKDLELIFLQETSSIGIDEVADLLDVTEFLKQWQEKQ